MPKYLVGRKEIHVAYVEVEAKDANEAVAKVAQYHEDIVETDVFEYSDTLDPDTWSVDPAETSKEWIN